MADLPPPSLSLAGIIERLRKSKPANYSYAQSRLGRQPMMFAHDPSQTEQVYERPGDYGETFPPTWEQRTKLAADPSRGPLADPLRQMLGEGQPVSVIAPEQSAIAGPAGRPGTEPGVPLHESTHQFLGSAKLPPAVLFSQMPPVIHQKVSEALQKMGYGNDQFGDEIPARLASKQYSSLGLTEAEGQQLWAKYLDLFQKVDPAKAQRLKLYTSGHVMDQASR